MKRNIFLKISSAVISLPLMTMGVTVPSSNFDQYAVTNNHKVAMNFADIVLALGDEFPVESAMIVKNNKGPCYHLNTRQQLSNLMMGHWNTHRIFTWTSPNKTTMQAYINKNKLHSLAKQTGNNTEWADDQIAYVESDKTL